jgi:hypothetical protein
MVVQSVPITTIVVSSNPVSFTNKTDRHDITESVESGVKQHKPKPICKQRYVKSTLNTSSAT